MLWLLKCWALKLSRNCGKRLTCRMCSQPHPTLLHVDRNAANSGISSKESEARKFLGSTETCDHKRAGKDHCLLSILPVQVKASKGDQIVQTYAFLAEHVSEAEQCDAQLNIPLCGRALHSVTHGQSKRSANVPLTLTGKPNPAQITLTLNVSSGPIFFPVYNEIIQ